MKFFFFLKKSLHAINVIFLAFVVVDFFQKYLSFLVINSAIRVSNALDPDPVLGPNCLQSYQRACADPGIFVRGVQVRLTKKALTTLFFLFFLVLSLFLQKSYGQFQNFKEIYLFSRFQRGSNIFQGGSNFFKGGSNCLSPIQTHIICDFPGGVRTPCSPLWIRT